MRQSRDCIVVASGGDNGQEEATSLASGILCDVSNLLNDASLIAVGFRSDFNREQGADTFVFAFGDDGH